MNRLKEPSTWAGFGTILQMCAALMPQYALPLHLVTVVAGTLAGVMAEGGGAAPTATAAA